MTRKGFHLGQMLDFPLQISYIYSIQQYLTEISPILRALGALR